MADKHKTLAEALLTQEASSTGEELQERLDIIRHKLKFVENKPAIACIEKLEPLTLAGHWVPEAIEVAGGIAVMAGPGEDSREVNWGQVSAGDPDIIVIAISGLSIEDTLREIAAFLQQPGFAQLKAVKNNRLYIADGNRLYASGPGIVDAIEMHAEIIHPKQFIFGFEGDGWMRFGV